MSELRLHFRTDSFITLNSFVFDLQNLSVNLTANKLSKTQHIYVATYMLSTSGVRGLYHSLYVGDNFRTLLMAFRY